MEDLRRLTSNFLFDTAPFTSCHAATIATVGRTLVAAWFGGSREGAPDVGIWLARRTHDVWTAPARVADGGDRPCWNPVLHATADGRLLLFWREGPSPRRWWSLVAISHDAGRTWTPPRRLPRGFLGPIKNRPLPLADGGLLCPSSSEHLGWRCHIEHADGALRTWRHVATLNGPWPWVANQPALARLHDGRVLALCRTRNGVVARSWSADDGRTWTPLARTGLANPNSGLDLARLPDGRLVLAANPVERGRSPLVLLVSTDGEAWRAAAVLADGPGEYSYPSLCVADDGTLHVVYTWRRQRIAHAAVTPADLAP